MNVLVISNNYPSKTQPNNGAFVYNLMQELAEGNQITIIAPFKITDVFKKSVGSYGKEKCTVKRPLYLSMGRRKIGSLDLEKTGNYLYEKAVIRSLKKLKVKPDIVYTHFLKNAFPVLEYCRENHIPLVIASGESTYDTWKSQNSRKKEKLKKQVDHVICVADKNKEKLKQLGFSEDKLTVIPNAVNYGLFKPLDKETCKTKLGIDKDKFVVGFVGHFIHRKGPDRIVDALIKLNDRDITLVCVGGKGKIKENDVSKILAPVPNYQLAEIYNAFDVFVLPTLNEGHCNVIEEAKACCVPVISSKGTSVEKQISEDTGILIDPLDIDEMALAIKELKEDGRKLNEMKESLNKLRGENSLAMRAQKINLLLVKFVQNTYKEKN